MNPSVIVSDLHIPISPSASEEEIYYDRTLNQLRISGDLLQYKGVVKYTFPYGTPKTAGSSISFDISSEGDTLWDTVGNHSSWRYGSFLLFNLVSSYPDGGKIRFLSCGDTANNSFGAVAASNLGHLYTVVFKYTNSYKTLNVTIKCAVE